MNLNSFIFLLFVLLAVTVYYLIPKRIQWIWLLLVSYIYYFANAGWALIFILITTVTTWYAALTIDHTESDRKRRTITALTLLLNFGILGVLKYTNFAVKLGETEIISFYFTVKYGEISQFSPNFAAKLIYFAPFRFNFNSISP